ALARLPPPAWPVRLSTKSMNAPHHRLPRPVGFVPMYLRASLTSELLVAPPYAEFECDCARARASARDRRLCPRSWTTVSPAVAVATEYRTSPSAPAACEVNTARCR